jgi:Ca2+-binding EF-hand superfamily protein
MSSTISSVGGYSSMMMQGMGRPQRPDPSKMAEDLFSQIDTSGKGYIEKTDLESAFQKLSSSSTSTADEIFSSLDGNGDGKITQDEMSAGIQKLSDALDSQFQSMRMAGAMGGMAGMAGMPPPPPPGSDAGFTKEELQAQLEELGSSDNKRSSLISTIIENFDAADTDSDGKVSFAEAMAYDQSNASSSTGTASTGDGTSAAGTAGSTSEAQLMLQVMKLMQAYGLFERTNESSGVTAVA